MRIEKFLVDLLYQHDCVVVPGFGGLVANYRSARLNDSSHVIYPPSKHVGFNRHLVHNDGLLASHVSSMMGISYKEAQALIEEHVAHFKKDLQTQGRLVWEKIGVFFKDTDGSLQFIPEDQENFLLSSFGFSPIQLSPVHRIQPVSSSQESVSPIVEKKTSGLVWKIAAAIAVPVALGAVWMLTANGGKSLFDLASFNPFDSQEHVAAYRMLTPMEREIETAEGTTGWESAMESMPNADRISFDFVEDKISDIGITVIVKEAVVADNTDTKHTAPAVKEVVSKNKFEIIGGAFAVEENATNMVAELQSKGYSAYLAGKKGPLHLVAIGNYASYSDAQKALREVRSNGTSAWIKRKK